jgi:RNA polymerase sigma-70 factor (ECF subfamily)
MTTEENQILARCKDGDRESFRWVVTTYQQRIFSLALKMLADEEEAKDVVQETFIRVWQKLDAYDLQRPFSTWLYTIATRLCLDRLKQKRAVNSLPLDEQTLHRFAADADSYRALENREWVSIVRLLAEGLSAKQRLVFTLCQLEGLPSSEVELITGMDARQMKSNLYVARQTIRKRLKELGYE